MKTKSINNNGCSVCESGNENYTTFIAGAFRGTQYYQYDYRHTDGELFSLSDNYDWFKTTLKDYYLCMLLLDNEKQVYKIHAHF